MADSHLISTIQPGSPADLAGLKTNDRLIAINGHELEDIFDYYYFSDDASFTVTYSDSDGQIHETLIQKEAGEDFGLSFANGLMDDYKSCSNHCMFCFIDQMPPGMRETLYFKDDDTRLSFLQGNYVTLTNMKEKDLKRIVDYHLAPINISVHATNPELRVKMLHNRFAGELMEKISYLADHDIEMNGQVVLCKGENDGGELDRTIEELLAFYPQMQSLSVVPVGLTKYRQDLYPLEPFGKEDAKKVVEQITRWQEIAFEKYGVHFVQASDEWYLLAGLDLPSEERYDGYIQLENGVGMLRLLHDEFMDALSRAHRPLFAKQHKITIATGKLAGPVLEDLLTPFREKFPKTRVEVVQITNYFFGEMITVSGLITGKDLKEQLSGKELGDRLLLPANMLRSGEEVFLDDMTKSQLEASLQVKIDIVKSSGQDLMNALLLKE